MGAAHRLHRIAPLGRRAGPASPRQLYGLVHRVGVCTERESDSRLLDGGRLTSCTHACGQTDLRAARQRRLVSSRRRNTISQPGDFAYLEIID